MQLINYSQPADIQYQEIKDLLSDKIAMSQNEINFLINILDTYKPQKILEIGVLRGGSSLVILNNIKNNPDAHLFSIDYLDEVGKGTGQQSDLGKKIGYLVDEKAPQLKEKWTLKTGGVAANFIDEIGGDIDLCFIDTVHFVPGEILDFLMVLPYLKENCVVVFHDTADHYVHATNAHWNKAECNCILISAIKGKKLIQKWNDIANIAAVILDKETRENLWDIFNLLILNWHYMINDNDYNTILEHLKKHYDPYFVDIFIKGYEYNKKKMEFEKQAHNRKNSTLENLFSVRNEYVNNGTKKKILTVLGAKFIYK